MVGLADAAVAAWSRDDSGEDDDSGEELDRAIEGESTEERIVRHRAGSLALIGLAVQNLGERNGETVRVPLSPWFIGHALDCAEERGLL